MLDRDMYTIVRAKMAEWWTTKTIDETCLQGALSAVYEAQQLQSPLLIWCESPFQLSLMPFLLTILACAPASSRGLLLKSLSDLRCRNALVSLTEQLCEKQQRSLANMEVPDLSNARNAHNTLFRDITLIAKDVNDAVSEANKSTGAAYRDVAVLTSAERTLERSQRLIASAIQHVIAEVTFNRFRSEGEENWRAIMHHTFDLNKFSLFNQTLEEVDWLLEGSLSSFDLHVNECTFSNVLTWGSISFDRMLRLSCLEAILGEGELAKHRQFKRLKPYLFIRKSAMAYLFTSKIVYASRSPVMVRFDNLQRLHSDIGPAIEFADGFQINCWHGTEIAPELAANPSLLTLDRIEREANAEVRSAMLEKYGFDRFITDSGAEKVSVDEHFGTLFRAFISGLPFCFVRVKNSSPEPDGSYKDYILQVPPDMRSAKEAVAWTFGMRESEYSPMIET
ncbi:hypothetical protein KF728_22995 [Candidatus Obscuribacterales bacterium]|nr:hypothetical protein [Candidatus Obscuribacterales bacterium]